ncbi:MAG: hypothetical protein RLZZ417_1356 [Bacteroidota bacterium]
MSKYFIPVFSISFLLFLNACKKDNLGEPKNEITFKVIQDQILTPSCALSGCHQSTTDGSFQQHKLLLSDGNSYQNLINKVPVNISAANAKMLLVQPGDAEKSFLFHKINCDSYIHKSAINFGKQMPLGGGVITKGQVELVKRWINTGASKDDRSLSLSILADASACQSDIDPLAPPANGFQLKIDKFDIQANFEREIFVRKTTPNTAPVYVNKIELKGRSNSHHFLVYGFNNTSSLPVENRIRDLRNPDGSLNLQTFAEMQNHFFVGGGTDVNNSVVLPEGAAIKIMPNMPVDLNAHYFNKTKLTLQGENYVNFHTIPASAVKNEVKMLDLNNVNFTLPPNQRKTITKNFTFSEKTHILLLTSHNHKLGEKFVIKILGGTRNGEVIYENTDWEHPLTKLFPNPIILNPGEGLTSEVTYNNITNRTISFGFTSEDEMNIIFGYYY